MISPIQIRQEKITKASTNNYDVLIVGGGIHGATLCRELCLRGYKVLLLEAVDYSFGASSRSSKMLHGGVRYLEKGDFGLVHEALQERAVSVAAAPHLGRAQKFFFPIVKKLTRPKWQVRIGLGMYDLLASKFGQGARNIFGLSKAESNDSPDAKKLREMGLNFSSILSYYDGQMDDARLVVENIIDAEELGGVTLNHAKVTGISRNPLISNGKHHPKWIVKWEDGLGGEEYTSAVDFVVNLAGPWVPEVHGNFDTWKKEWHQPVFSRGIHLLFDVEWKNPGLILPTNQIGRVYFVLPYFSATGQGTLVGTTDRKVDDNEFDPIANQSEIDEILGFLKRDLPNSGLNEKSLYQTFCGMRILASKPGKGSANASKYSRKDIFIKEEGYLCLLGGKYTSSRSTSEKMAKMIDQAFGKTNADHIKESSRKRPLPGGKGWSEEGREKLIQEIVSYLLEGEEISESVSAQALDNATWAVNRFGMRARDLINTDKTGLPKDPKERKKLNKFKLIEGYGTLLEEIRITIIEEQACSVDDVLRRRLGLSLQPPRLLGEPGKMEEVVREELQSLLGESFEQKSELRAET
jgi:glycerol-3-phosphate dehydrogenase